MHNNKEKHRWCSILYTWGLPNWNYAEVKSLWATDYPQALELIKQAVQGERNDELMYEELIRLAPTKYEQDIIASIRDDERKHNQMFRLIYQQLTGQTIPPSGNEPYEKIQSYILGLINALFGELAAVEKYRTIWASLPVGGYRDTVLGIIMDEQKHASKYNFLIAINLTNMKMK